MDDFVVCFENEVKAIWFRGAFWFTARLIRERSRVPVTPWAAGIFSNITNKSGGKLGGRDQSKMVGGGRDPFALVFSCYSMAGVAM